MRWQFFYFLFALLAAQTTWAQTNVVNKGITITINGVAITNVDTFTNGLDSLTQTSSGEVRSNDTLELKGDVVNNGVNGIFTTQGTVLFTGDTHQNTLGDTSVTYYKIALQKAGGEFRMFHPLTIGDQVVFGNGHMANGGWDIDLGLNADFTNENENSRVTGPGGFVRARRFLSAPNAASNIAGIGLFIGGTQNYSFTDIERANSFQIGAGQGSINRYWNFSPTNDQLADSTKLRYFQADLAGYAEDSLAYWQSNTGGTVWFRDSSSLDTVNNIIAATDNILRNSILSAAPRDCNTNPTINLPDSIASCAGDTVQLNVNNPGNFYTWSTGDSTESIFTDSTGLYFVTVTDVFGCSSSDTTFVKAEPFPVANFTRGFECLGDTNDFFATSTIADNSALSNYWDFGVIGIASDTAIGDTAIYLYPNSGNFSARLITESAFGCADTISKSVIIHSFPAVNFSANSACEDSLITFMDSSTVAAPYSIMSRNWDLGDGTTSAQTTLTNTYPNAGNYNIKLTITSNAGCSSTDSNTVVISPNPTAGFTAAAGCEGTPLTLANTSTVSGGTLVFAWDFGDGTTSTDSLPAKTYNADSTYTISLLATTGPGCFDADTQNVTVNDIPSVVFTTDSACTIETLQFTNASIVKNSTLNYAWTFGDGTSSTLTNPTKTYANAGGYTVKLVGTSGFGCQDSATGTAVTYPIPTAGFTSNVVCEGNATAFLNSSSIATGTINYAWDFGLFTPSSTATNPNFQFASSGTYPAKLVVVSNFGCRDSITNNAVVNANPVVNLGGNVTTCGSTFNLDASNPGASYAWSSFATTQTYLVTNDGTYSVTVTNANGCVGADTTNVLLNSTPSTNIGPDTAVCGSYVLNAFSNGGNYLWSNSSTDSAIVVTTSGTYAVTVTDQNNCISGDTAVVTIFNAPTVNLGNDTAFCAGNALTLNAGNSGATFSWSTGAIGQNISASTSGIYRVTITNGNGCSAADTIAITVNPLPIFSLGADTSNCGPTSISTSISGVTYNWNMGATTDTIPVTTTGSYSVTTTNGNQCSFSDTISISIFIIPTVALPADKQLCDGLNDTLNALSSKPVSSYVWDNGSTDSTLAVTVTGNYSLTITDVDGCKASDTTSIQFNAAPVVSLGGNLILCLDDTATFSTGRSDWQHQWGSSTGANGVDTLFNFSDSGRVWLTAIDTLGCTGTDTVVVNKLNQAVQARFLMASAVSIGDTVEFVQLSFPDPLNYAWSFGDGGTSTDSTGSHIYFLQDTFDVTLIVDNGSCSDTLTKPIVVGPAFKKANEEDNNLLNNALVLIKSFKAYPVPTADGLVTCDLELNREGEEVRLTLYDLAGTPLQSLIFSEKKFSKQMNLNSYARGFYFINAASGRERITRKIVFR